MDDISRSKGISSLRLFIMLMVETIHVHRHIQTHKYSLERRMYICGSEIHI